jgi:hypothetical protein
VFNQVFKGTTRNLLQHRQTAVTPVLEEVLKRLSEEDLESQLDVEGLTRSDAW